MQMSGSNGHELGGIGRDDVVYLVVRWWAHVYVSRWIYVGKPSLRCPLLYIASVFSQHWFFMTQMIQMLLDDTTTVNMILMVICASGRSTRVFLNEFKVWAFRLLYFHSRDHFVPYTHVPPWNIPFIEGFIFMIDLRKPIVKGPEMYEQPLGWCIS